MFSSHVTYVGGGKRSTYHVISLKLGGVDFERCVFFCTVQVQYSTAHHNHRSLHVHTTVNYCINSLLHPIALVRIIFIINLHPLAFNTVRQQLTPSLSSFTSLNIIITIIIPSFIIIIIYNHYVIILICLPSLISSICHMSLCFPLSSPLNMWCLSL